MGGSNPELIVASVALVVSFVALTATFMQVLQQYYASASGYSQCSREVMGAWANSKSRRFSWDELRFVVQFDTPVIFISSPSNRKGALTGPDILFLDGTPQSREKTGVPEDGREEERTSEDRDETEPRRDAGSLSPEAAKETESKERVQTANHERASWLVLLDAVHRMEAKSCQWQTEQYKLHGPPNRVSEEHGLPHAPPTLQGSHTLTVALQRKRKSWDTMPASVSRPYATTTICHLVDTMAILGLYWKEFDRSRDRYRAEGNGYLVLGEKVSNLGLMFSLQRYGSNTFQRNRIVPLDEVKELCFGFVPTIYRKRKGSNEKRGDALANELRDLESLQMATKSEIAETLVAIGCNKNSVQHFSNESGKTTHLFPMSFEIVGMLARTFHIDDTCFTFLPNPTPDRWDERSLSLVKIMESYRTLSRVEPAEVARSAVIHRRLARHMDSILRPHGDEGVEWLIFLKSLHAALADADEILTARPSRGCVGISGHSQTGAEAQPQQHRREVVRDVLRSHIQEVLRLLNEDRGFESQPPLGAGVRPMSPTGLRADMPRGSPTFEEINEASPDDRQDKFMQVYFEVIRPQVVWHAQESTSRRAAPAIPEPRHRQAGSPVASPGTVATITGPEDACSGGLRGASSPEGDERHVSQDDEVRHEHAEPTSLANEPASHDDIWCVLVFRMICWLMLHDFHRDDVQMSKSELLGSRMPVYIA